MKKVMRFMAALFLMISMSATTALAAGWVGGQGANEGRWWYDLGEGQYYAGAENAPSWQWIDGNQDGTAECYAFDAEGWLYTDTVTPDGYQVDGNGAWTENGIPQTKVSETAALQAGSQDQAAGSTLIVYFSKTGTTEQAAQRIQEVTGGTLVELEPVNAYPSSYSETLTVAQRELDQDARPALSTTVADMGQYDTVFIGYPIWFGTAPKVIETFLESYDFTGKTIVPFCTSGSSGIESSVRVIRSHCPESNVLSGLRLNDVSGVEAWVNGLGL